MQNQSIPKRENDRYCPVNLTLKYVNRINFTGVDGYFLLHIENKDIIHLDKKICFPQCLTRILEPNSKNRRKSK